MLRRVLECFIAVAGQRLRYRDEDIQQLSLSSNPLAFSLWTFDTPLRLSLFLLLGSAQCRSLRSFVLRLWRLSGIRIFPIINMHCKHYINNLVSGL